MSKQCPCLQNPNHPGIQTTGDTPETRVCSCADCGRVLWRNGPEAAADDNTDQILADVSRATERRTKQPVAASVAQQSAIDEFEAKVAEAMTGGKNKMQATRAVVVSDPDLHQRYLAEINAR